MDYKAILFDFDYTLANSEEGILTCFHQVFAQNGYADIRDETIVETIGITLDQAFRKLTGENDDALIERLRKEYVAQADIYMTAKTRPYPGVIDTLKALHGQGIKLGIISNKFASRIRESLEEWGVANLFSVLIGAADVTRHKPEPEPIYLALEHLGLSRTDVLYVGDSLVDAETAENANVNFCAVTTGRTTAEAFSIYPCQHVYKSLAELNTGF